MAKLSPKRKAFINAYLGEAKGNATQAAILAGYSPNGATQQASYLLTCTDVQEALGKRVERAQMTADESLEELSEMARAKVDKVTGMEKLKANELILKVLGKLREKEQDSGKVTVNIGFLGQQPTAITIEGQTAMSQQLVVGSLEPVVVSSAAPVLLARTSEDPQD